MVCLRPAQDWPTIADHTGPRAATGRRNIMRLAGKVAIVTGASSGMGAATARLFGREGAKVVLTDLLEAEGGEVARSITSAGGEARFWRHDVASEPDWEAAVAATHAAYGGIEIGRASCRGRGGTR